MAYAAKYASSFYGPFREAPKARAIRRPENLIEDPANADEAIRRNIAGSR